MPRLPSWAEPQLPYRVLFLFLVCVRTLITSSVLLSMMKSSPAPRGTKKKKKKFRGVYTTSAEVAQSCGFRWAFWPSIGVFSITMICLYHSWFGLQRSTSIAQDLQRPCSRPHTAKPSTMHGLLSTNEHPNVRISESCGNRVFIFSGEFV